MFTHTSIIAWSVISFFWWLYLDALWTIVLLTTVYIVNKNSSYTSHSADDCVYQPEVDRQYEKLISGENEEFGEQKRGHASLRMKESWHIFRCFMTDVLAFGKQIVSLWKSWFMAMALIGQRQKCLSSYFLALCHWVYAKIFLLCQVTTGVLSVFGTGGNMKSGLSCQEGILYSSGGHRLSFDLFFIPSFSNSGSTAFWATFCFMSFVMFGFLWTVVLFVTALLMHMLTHCEDEDIFEKFLVTEMIFDLKLPNSHSFKRRSLCVFNSKEKDVRDETLSNEANEDDLTADDVYSAAILSTPPSKSDNVLLHAGQNSGVKTSLVMSQFSPVEDDYLLLSDCDANKPSLLQLAKNNIYLRYKSWQREELYSRRFFSLVNDDFVPDVSPCIYR